jgi:hypothetical protein
VDDPASLNPDRAAMTHPYADLPPRAYWRSAVAQADRMGFADLYHPRVLIGPATRVATAGSCFAQHIARALRGAGVRVMDAEPAPAQVPDDVAQRFGYRLFSGRYGNIYTARQMVQLLDEMIAAVPDPTCVWPLGDRFVDAFRPTVEPDGLDTADEVLLHRDWHLERTKRMLMDTDLFIFTLGLTEAWADSVTGRVFPLCPGVAGGVFDPGRHRFVNFRVAEVEADLHALLAALRRFNPDMRMLVTVSPVPLTATASGDHVLTATSQSKAVLRAAAGAFVADCQGTDYFPSYELVTHPAAGGPWFAENLRSVTEAGVARVMAVFLAAHGLAPAPVSAPVPEDPADDGEDPLVCDELLLGAVRSWPETSV